MLDESDGKCSASPERQAGRPRGGSARPAAASAETGESGSALLLQQLVQHDFGGVLFGGAPVAGMGLELDKLAQAQGLPAADYAIGSLIVQLTSKVLAWSSP